MARGRRSLSAFWRYKGMGVFQMEGGLEKKDEGLVNHRKRYKLKKEIGYGSSAAVYCAEDVESGACMAIKIIDLTKYNTKNMPSLWNEIKVMKECQHSNLLPVCDSFVSEEELWIIMPYYSHGSVYDIIRYGFCNGFANKYVIASIMLPVLRGLDYLHRKGYIHRDVKAANILLDKNGHVCLGDFGVSYCLEQIEGEKPNLRKTFVGTPSWMAPEVMEMVRGYTSKADIWSFGITLVELMLGKTPYTDLRPMHVVSLVLSKPKTVDEMNIPKIHGNAFRDLVGLCLQRDPEKRPSAEELLHHSFFRHAKDPSYLIEKIISVVPPSIDRIDLSLSAGAGKSRTLLERLSPVSSEEDDSRSHSERALVQKGRFHLIEESEEHIDIHRKEYETETRRGRFEIIANDKAEGLEGEIDPNESQDCMSAAETRVESPRPENAAVELRELETRLEGTILRKIEKKMHRKQKKDAKKKDALPENGGAWISAQKEKIRQILLLSEIQTKSLLELLNVLAEKERELEEAKN
eukprot:GHVN01070094.1.p3 GENE.GHVN01070094.1~~GHVN01070094.1.p3  ORF type:complete len:521 (+),score=59.30 GHVN01070094.1:4297-5859(+)